MAQLIQEIMPIPPREVDNDTALLVAPTGYALSGGKMLPQRGTHDLFTGWPILTALGSYWARQFNERGKLLKLYRASAALAAQTHTDWLETAATISRFECPVFHQRIWHAFVLRESDMGVSRASMLKYNGFAIYNGLYRYGVPIFNVFQSMDLGKLRNIGALLNKIIDPTLAWTRGADFYINTAENALSLRSNPFNDSRIPVTHILNTAGTVVDREVVLWGFNTEEDWSYIYEHFGYALRYKASVSSASYRDFVNALWNGLTGGLSTFDFEWALAAVAGLPVVKEQEETVEVILTQPDKTVIVTDQHAYLYPAGSVTKVAVGGVVYAGQVLVDTVVVYDLANYEDIVALLQDVRRADDGTIVTRDVAAGSLEGYIGHRAPSKIRPDPVNESRVYAIPVPKGALVGNYRGSLAFLNREMSYVNSDVDAEGNAIGKITGVIGAPEDIDLLWNTAHAAGVADGELWIKKVGTPIPAYVNPAGFAIEHFLRDNVIVVYLRYTRFGPEALGLTKLALLRRVLPPEKLVLFLVDVDIDDLELSDDGGLLPDEITAADAGEDLVLDLATGAHSGYADEAVDVFYPDICG